MRIEALSAVFPSRVVTNDDILRMIEGVSKKDQFEGGPVAFESTKKLILRFLRTSGSSTRRWLASNETSLELTIRACKKAMEQLGPEKRIDLLIVASVHAELIEPATSNLIAHEIGLDGVECFDLKEACDGWMKAMKFADSFIKSGLYERVMIVNPEFVMREGFGIYPELFNLSSSSQLEYRFPAFTLGEVATCVIVTRDDENKWVFSNHTRNDWYDICSITAPYNPAGFVQSARVGVNGAGKFVSYGADLKKKGYPIVIDQFKSSGILPEQIDHLFTHSSSRKDWSEVARDLGLTPVFHDIYGECGNVVSAAVPTAMAIAFERGRLKRGDKVFALVASAGMSFSTAYFRF